MSVYVYMYNYLHVCIWMERYVYIYIYVHVAVGFIEAAGDRDSTQIHPFKKFLRLACGSFAFSSSSRPSLGKPM